jgi:hypothetical protein
VRSFASGLESIGGMILIGIVGLIVGFNVVAGCISCNL